MSKPRNGLTSEKKSASAPLKLGRSPITGHMIYAPQAKGGSITLDQAREAVARVTAARKG